MIYLMFNPLKAAAEIENYKLSSPCIKSSMIEGKQLQAVRGEQFDKHTESS